MADGTPIAPRADYALSFDGVSSHVEIASLARNDTGPRTIEAYVTPGRLDKEQWILVYTGQARDIVLEQNESVWSGRAVSGPLVRSVNSSPNLLLIGNRTHVAAVWDGKDYLLFIDGKSACPRPARHLIL